MGRALLPPLFQVKVPSKKNFKKIVIPTNGRNLLYAGETSTPQPDATDHGIINVRLIRETTILEDGTQSKTETHYETFQQQFVDPTYLYPVTRLNPIEKGEYDFGAGARGR